MAKSTHFGFQTVPEEEKSSLVSGVFDSVAGQYDQMNDLMSLGLHRCWKQCALRHCLLRPQQVILDLAGGTGDLTIRMHQHLKGAGHFTLADINASMLARAKMRLVDRGLWQAVRIVEADAQALPFATATFDRVVMAFGLRNVTRIDQALQEIYRVLKPGGLMMVLEFSKPSLAWLEMLYDRYSFSVLPKLGQWVVGDSASYQYLAESIRMHPDQVSLCQMIADAGFERVKYTNLSAGIVAIHRGVKC